MTDQARRRDKSVARRRERRREKKFVTRRTRERGSVKERKGRKRGRRETERGGM